jgi:hypothetical protein
MLFIDSVYPKRLFELRKMPDLAAGPIVKSPEELKAMKLREKVDLNMTHARMMVSYWKMPDWKGREAELPPTILMRAKELVQENGESFVDYARDLRMLGWDLYLDDGGAWIKEVVDIEGHHYNIFEDKHVSYTLIEKVTV